MAITALPTPPTRSDPTNFAERADDFMTALPTFVTQANALETNVNAKEALATAAANLAVPASEAAVGAANFAGAWSGLTGALNVPASVSHSGAVWLLLSNLADVTTATPGVSGAWQSLSEMTNIVVTNDNATNATHYIHFGDAASGTDNIKVASTKLTFNPSTGVLTSTDVTITSDERLKTEWGDVAADFVEGMAAVRRGTYRRLDGEARQVGVSAQSLRAVLPEAVHEDENGMLSVAYANAALVLSIELAREVVALRKELDDLRGATK